MHEAGDVDPETARGVSAEPCCLPRTRASLRIHLHHLLVEGGDIRGAVTVRRPEAWQSPSSRRSATFTIRNGVHGTKRLLAIAALHRRERGPHPRGVFRDARGASW